MARKIKKSIFELSISNRPTIVVLCGSTKFQKEYEEINFQETMKGKIVLSVGAFVNGEHIVPKGEKAMLDHIHLQKIDLADEVIIINPGNYIGESTMKEIRYAYQKKKSVRFIY
jgi:predicted phosphodiesterase